MHYTKDLSATVLFLVLKKASRLERIVGAESWHDMDPRWDAVQTYEIHSNSEIIFSICNQMNAIFEKRQLCHRLVSFDHNDHEYFH